MRSFAFGEIFASTSEKAAVSKGVGIVCSVGGILRFRGGGEGKCVC